MILEPISISCAGFFVPPREFLPLVREICDKHGVLLIFDEIITGFGRLGARFGAEYYGVTPDIICCGKGMSSGYAPLAAMIFKDSVQDAFLGEEGERREFHHGHTFGGNPVACAAGLAALGQIVGQGLVEQARVKGAFLRGKMEEMYAKYPIVGDVRGAGMLQGVEFVRDRATKEPFPHAQAPGTVIDRLAPRARADPALRRRVRRPGAAADLDRGRPGRDVRHPGRVRRPARSENCSSGRGRPSITRRGRPPCRPAQGPAGPGPSRHGSANRRAKHEGEAPAYLSFRGRFPAGEESGKYQDKRPTRQAAGGSEVLSPGTYQIPRRLEAGSE